MVSVLISGAEEKFHIYVEITDPEGFGGNSVFCYFARFNKMQMFWGGASHKPEHVQSNFIQ